HRTRRLQPARAAARVAGQPAGAAALGARFSLEHLTAAEGNAAAPRTPLEDGGAGPQEPVRAGTTADPGPGAGRAHAVRRAAGDRPQEGAVAAVRVGAVRGGHVAAGGGAGAAADPPWAGGGRRTGRGAGSVRAGHVAGHTAAGRPAVDVRQ